MPATVPTPTVADVERIAAVADPVVRNLQITQCYAELARAMAQRVGPGANWCTFATWASKQAGQTIRQEDLIRTLETKLKHGPAAAPMPAAAAQHLGVPASAAAMEETIWQVLDPRAPFDRASAAVARGNLKVFAEIGREFARYLATCAGDAVYNPANIDAFCADLRPGDPPDGQEYLRRAFARYYRASFEPASEHHAQWLLLANLEIGLHEQTRLQPEIQEALDAPVVDPRTLARRLADALLPKRDWWNRTRLWWDGLRNRPTPFDGAVDAFLARVRLEVRAIVSEQLMSITLPPALRLRLGKDLTAPFPPSLAQITEPALYALLAELDPTPDSPRATAAADWSSLPERLHFIADLFRCYQEWPPLFDPPFDPTQTAALKAGRRPPPPL